MRDNKGVFAMAFGGFKDLSDVALTYQITLRPEPFVQPVPMPISDEFRRRLEFDRLNAPVSVSEQAISEFLIAPILQEMWRAYSDSLMIWSHVQFGKTPPLIGFPDYFFSRRSPLGRVRDQPYVLFVEAKNDDFDPAWAQCLAAMRAAQQLNQRPDQLIFGSVSSGEFWFFGKLDGATLIQDPRSFTVTHLDELFAALNFVFQQAKLQALAATPAKQLA
jgi:hypothetical protein